jgi:hypothetical protein
MLEVSGMKRRKRRGLKLKSKSRATRMDWSDQTILETLDACWEFSCTFPVLDNPYVYLAATRLSAYRSRDDWGLVIEVFEFMPRGGVPDTYCYTIGSRIVNRDSIADYVTAEAHANYLSRMPHCDTHRIWPIDNDEWQDPDDIEMVKSGASTLVLRGQAVAIPKPEECRRHGVELMDAPRIRVFECCRVLAAAHREEVLATAEERRHMLPDDLDQILQLEEWYHPDLADPTVRPSCNETFIQLASVLASGDATLYEPTLTPNTHWANWPLGGTM